eukprot:GGOE01007877.1.p1 GENE.GGOE01007877.1~~GGOE01007877.1.p1  ORF type:complete len:504 (-),score=19.75 GGOE01007877.1:998-2368(-)
MRKGQLYPEDEYYLEPPLAGVLVEEEPPIFRLLPATECRARFHAMDGIDCLPDSGPLDSEVKGKEIQTDVWLSEESLKQEKEEEMAVIHTIQETDQRRREADLKEGCDPESWTVQNALRRFQPRCQVRQSSDGAVMTMAWTNITNATPRSARSFHTPRSSRSLTGTPRQSVNISPRFQHGHGDSFLQVGHEQGDSTPRSVFSDSCLSVQCMGGVERALVRSDSEYSIVSMTAVTKQLHHTVQKEETGRISHKEFCAAESSERMMRSRSPEVARRTPKSAKKSTKAIGRAMSDRDSSKFSSNDSVGHSSFDESLGRSSQTSSQLKSMLPPSVGNVLTWNRPRPGATLEASPTASRRKQSPKRGPSRVSAPAQNGQSRGLIPSARSTISVTSSPSDFGPDARKRSRARVPSPPPTTPATSPVRLRPEASPKTPAKCPDRVITRKPDPVNIRHKAALRG